MEATRGICFEEARCGPVHLPGEAALGRAPGSRLSQKAVQSVKRHQVERLKINIGFLRRKQERFNRKLEEYIQGIRALILALEESLVAGEGADRAAPPEERRAGTRVCCLGCGEERLFAGLKVLHQRDSAGAVGGTGTVIVEERGAIKKGRFRCLACREESLSIRSLDWE
jgi:hypothetical protein